MNLNFLPNWYNFYNNIKASHWPDCNSRDDLLNLPDVIKLEVFNSIIEHAELVIPTPVSHTVSVDRPITSYLHLLFVQLEFQSADIKTSMEDLVFMYSLTLSLRPDNVLEIGRFKGSSTFLLSKALADNNHGHLHSVDIEDYLSDNVRSVISKNVTLHQCSSEFLLEDRVLGATKFKLFFIDGDHTQIMTENDIETCLALAEPGAYIMVHDNNMVEVTNAIDRMVSKHTALYICGDFGSRIRLLKVAK